MMSFRGGHIALAFSLLWLSFVGLSAQSGVSAPRLAATLIDGAPFDLSQASARGPVLLYFTSTGCPVAAKANPYFDRLGKAFKGSKVRFVAVINSDLKSATSWMHLNRLQFDAIPDGQYKIIKSYGVKKAPACFLIASGKIVRSWDGWSKAILQQIIDSASKQARIAAPNISLRGAPAELETG